MPYPVTIERISEKWGWYLGLAWIASGIIIVLLGVAPPSGWVVVLLGVVEIVGLFYQNRKKKRSAKV